MHLLTHPTPVEGCFGCKALSVSMTPSATGAIEPRRIELADKRLDADLSAYRRLRHDGLQPKAIDGSAELEKRVGDQHDIDLGRYVPKEERSRVEEGAAMAKEMFG